MAFHSAQGPQLGLPQMIQSRPQFGYVGALLVWLFAYLQYAGFNIFNTILGRATRCTPPCTAGQAVDRRRHGVAASSSRWSATTSSTASSGGSPSGSSSSSASSRSRVFTLDFPAGSFDLGDFKATPFLVQFGVVAGYQISWAIYVSDYSRYLPPDVTVRKTFLWTYWGSALGAIWLMCLGAVLAAWAGEDFDTIASINAAGDTVFDGFGAIVLIFSTLGLVSVTALNMYGGSLTLISAIDSFTRVRPTLTVRIVDDRLHRGAVARSGAGRGEDFLTNFENFLLLVLYLFIPWTAVNLVDYYIVRRGHYAIAEIFNPHGMYGRWGWRGIVSYLVGFAAMVPFLSTSQYTGFVADALDGADMSLFIGLPVAGVLYYVLARSIDVEAETRVADAEAAELEGVAGRHQRPRAD